ncbi:MAG: type III pantothenate kinase, partial [Acidobacteria bacterium]|nr:type III pantothenate kinase [Acidobacteriota bacterium]
MLLAIDVGNTNIVVGVFDGDRLIESWRLTTLRERTADELGILIIHLFEHRGLDRSGIEASALASVVPSLTAPTAQMIRRYFGRDPLIVEPGLATGMPILYDNPA